MNKYLPYIAAFIIAVQSFTPPLEFEIHFVNNQVQFAWVFLLCAFLAFWLIFTSISPWLKVLMPYAFISCFLSRDPHGSMTTFVWLTLAMLFYRLCLKIQDWSIIFKTIACIACVNLAILLLQLYGKDTLYNFHQPLQCLGTIGNEMQVKSFLLVAVAFMIAYGKPKFLAVYPWATVAFIIGSMVSYCVIDDVFKYFIYARGSVWYTSLALTGQHPIVGMGLGTFKSIFPVLAHGHFTAEGTWTNAHNTFIQMEFELGAIGLCIFSGWVLSLLSRARGFLLAGVIIVGFTMMVHFPERQSTVVPIMIAFAAFAQQQSRKEVYA